MLGGMTLDQYLSDKGITEPVFAAAAGLSQSYVNRLRKGAKPSWDTINKVVKATGGAVTVNDFFAAHEAAE